MSLLIETAGCIADVLDVRVKSVMLAIEDGMDTVPQISALTQILLDPYYRLIAIKFLTTDDTMSSYQCIKLL